MSNNEFANLIRWVGDVMRIAIFSDTYTPEINGVARTLNRFIENLEKKGIEYRLFVPESRVSLPTVPQIERFMSLPLVFYSECRLALPNPTRIKETLDKFNPTIIHITTPFNLGLFGLHYGKHNNIPMVASYHTHFDQYLDCYNLSFLKKWVWKYLQWFHQPFEKVYAPSESTKEKLLLKKIHSQIEIWGRGVDHILFSPTKRTNNIREKYKIKEKNILLFVGRIAQEKDIQTVLNTFSSLSNPLQIETHLLIVVTVPFLISSQKINIPKLPLPGLKKAKSWLKFMLQVMSSYFHPQQKRLVMLF
jgi:glycosyltransferase involved in cell wall biosynthesis